MKKKELALCDLDAGYITMFASFLMEHYLKEINIHIFTTCESFFEDRSDFDVGIMSQEFEDILYFKKEGKINKKYFLCEDVESASENHIYKYQAIDRLVSSIKEIDALGLENTGANETSENKAKVIGVYSPVSHELQLPFSMALSESIRDGGRVLFLDLEELSIMPGLIGNDRGKNLMDLIYEISTNAETVELQEYIHQFMGMDYIEPFYNPDEISEVDEETWLKLLDKLRSLQYDNIVILFGRAICGFSKIIDSLEQLYVLGKPGDYYQKGQEAFMEFLTRAGKSVSAKSVLLPMSAGNLTEGTYCIEELLRGNLGIFVKKLLRNDRLAVNYG